MQHFILKLIMNLAIRTTAKQMDVELKYKKADNHDKTKKKEIQHKR